MNFINSIQHPRPLIGSSFTPPVISGLVQYVTFDAIYNTSGGVWTSGSGAQCCGNIATSDTPTNIYNGIGVGTTSFETVKPNKPTPTSWTGGVYSVKVNNTLFRHTLSPTYQFPTNGLSFSCWFKLNANISSTFLGLWGFAQTAANSYTCVVPRLYGLTSGTPSTSPPYYFNLGIEVTPTIPSGTNTGAGAVAVGDWYHFVWTIRAAAHGAATTHTLYLDGVSIYTNATLAYPSGNVRQLIDIGAYPNGGGINGNIDTFRYYSTELSQANVTNIYTTLDPQVIR